MIPGFWPEHLGGYHFHNAEDVFGSERCSNFLLGRLLEHARGATEQEVCLQTSWVGFLVP